MHQKVVRYNDSRVYNFLGRKLTDILKDKEFAEDLKSATKVESSTIDIYVDQRYTGVAGVTITATGITSTNPSYNEQLNNAAPGLVGHPYPCLWSAQHAAKHLLEEGEIDQVNIIVKSGYYETIGSPTLTQNGDQNANPAINQEPNLKVSSAAADLYAFSLGLNGVNYHFEQNTKIINLCKAYAIPLINLTANPDFYITNFYGKGEFRWLYGQAEFGEQRFMKILGVVDFHMVFEAQMVMINMFRPLEIKDFQYIKFKVNQFYIYEGIIKVAALEDAKANGRKNPLLIVEIEDMRVGRNIFTGLPPAANDYWCSWFVGGAYGLDAFFYIDRYLITPYGSSDGPMFRVENEDTKMLKDNNIQVNVRSLQVGIVPGREANSTSPLTQFFRSSNANATLSKNNVVKIHIGSAVSPLPLGSNYSMFECQDSVICFQCDHWLNPGVVPSAVFHLAYWGNDATPAYQAANNKLFISGNYVSKAANPMFTHSIYRDFPDPGRCRIIFQDCVIKQEVAGQPVLNFAAANTHNSVTLKNTILCNDGVTEIITNTGTKGGMDILCQNLMINGPLSANVRTFGTAPVVTPNIEKYI